MKGLVLDMKKNRNDRPNRHTFLIALGLSTLVIAFFGIMGRNSLYAGYEVDLVKVPQLAVVFQGIKDAKYPWDIFGKESTPSTDEKDINEDTINDNDIASSEDSSDLDKYRVEDTEDTIKDSTKDTAITDIAKNSDKNTTQNVSPLSQNKTTKGSTGKTITKHNSTKNNTNTKNNTKTEEATTKSFEKVDKSYFKDALFIGDSRTIGLQEYSGWTEPTYYASNGISIYEIFDKDIAKVDGKMMTVDKALEKKKFGKIYIMLGINELGTGTAKSFAKEYQSVVEEIQELQPDAIIYIQSIMNVSKKKSDSDKIFNNSNIKERNNALAKIADNKKIFYLDVNQAFNDSSGAIPANYTFDGIHLKAAYYKLWADVLLKNGIKL